MSLADLMKKGSLRQLATVTVATTATVGPDSLPSVASVATVSVANAQKQAANDAAATTADPDRWCWPHSEAMNTGEIDTFTARVARFTDKGLGLNDAENLADKLVKRDREPDDRRLCLECSHLAGHAAGSWGCRNWQAAGIAIRAKDAAVSATLVHQLQRGDGFKKGAL
ncbi:MAG: hypothetical protein H7293_00905 [Candidatus Saccharibacteria bacterium]|nr:hypothetical protein [Rhodoferax sp.]